MLHGGCRRVCCVAENHVWQHGRRAGAVATLGCEDDQRRHLCQVQVNGPTVQNARRISPSVLHPWAAMGVIAVEHIPQHCGHLLFSQKRTPSSRNRQHQLCQLRHHALRRSPLAAKQHEDVGRPEELHRQAELPVFLGERLVVVSVVAHGT